MIQFVSFSLIFENEQNPDGDPYSCIFNAMDKEIIWRYIAFVNFILLHLFK